MLNSVSRPAPTLGWVTNKNIGGMQPSEALVLDNYFPRANTVDLINGDTTLTSGLGGPVETLAQWAGYSTSQLIAAANGALTNITGGAKSSLGTGFGSNRWQTVNFGTTSGNYLCLVNGSDPYQLYNGTALSVPSITVNGYTSADFIHINVFKGRLFFVIKNSLKFGYLPQLAIQGTVALFDLSQFAKRGGYLVAMATWTRDGYSGSDDYAVFLTSEGEALIYQGSDPSTANDWALVGTAYLGRPVGRRCTGQFRGDLAVLTYNGLLTLTADLATGQFSAASETITNNINPTYSNSVQLFGANFGWELCFYPKQKMEILNIPIVTDSMAYQYVVNTDTGGWCRFTQHQALTWCVFNNNLYYGDGLGNVFQADNGNSIHGGPIVGVIQTAYDYFDDPTSNKEFQLVRPTLLTSGPLNYSYTMNVDFHPSTSLTGGSVGNNSTQTPWGSPWGSAWSASTSLSSRWLSGSKIGRCASFQMMTSTINQSISLQSIDYAWQKIGLL